MAVLHEGMDVKLTGKYKWIPYEGANDLAEVAQADMKKGFDGRVAFRFMVKKSYGRNKRLR